jgi:hypothetical protein
MFDVSQHTFSAGCLTCTEYGVECTTSRPFRRGGRKLTPQNKGTRGAVRTSIEVEDLPVDRQSKEAPLDDSKFGLQNLIRRLVQIYHDTMYPKYASFLRHNPSSSNTANFLGSFPFLPKKDLLARWAEQVPDSNGGSYMLLMALCAVSSQTTSLNAVFDHSLLEGVKIPDCENYFCEAISVIRIRIVECLDFDYLRSFGLLAVYSIQRGNHNNLHRYSALCHALVA